MNSEKVKEIKKALECCAKKNRLPCTTCIKSEETDVVLTCRSLLEDILTLINELEKENKELKVDLKNSIDMQKQMLDGFKTVIKEVEENLAREIPNLLKQFAERLKEKLEEYRLENEYFIKDEPNGNLWQLNASVFCIEVTQDGGLVDETLNEFLKGENNE